MQAMVYICMKWDYTSEDIRYVSKTVNETVLVIGCCLCNQNIMRQPY